MKEQAIKLTFVHPWMTVSDAELLLHHAYMRFRSSKRYGGWKTVETLMKIEYGIFERSSEEHMRARLSLVKSENC